MDISELVMVEEVSPKETSEEEESEQTPPIPDTLDPNSS